MVGIHKRMENEILQDKTVTLEVMHRLMKGLKKEYLKAGTNYEVGVLSDMSVFNLASFW